MVSDIRKERLSKLYGMQSTLCFQVFCAFSSEKTFASKFDELIKQHNLPSEADFGIHALPNTQIGEMTFSINNRIYCVGETKGGNLTFAESIFSSTNKDLIRRVQKFYENDDYICLSNPVLDKIIGKYIPEIEQQLPEANFASERVFDNGDISIEFKFGIQPYDFDLHPPYDMDVLKPITIIDGYTIEPSKPESLDLTLV